MLTSSSVSPATRRSIDLEGVPETMLWSLWNRAAETRRPDRLIDDPMAAELVRRIDYDFLGHFGKPRPFHAIRARVCDDLIRTWLAREPGPDSVVVALGGGLDTQLWRIDDERLRWIGVDLPESIRARRNLLPPHPRATLVECSALDPAWMDAVPPGARPFITATGLLKYFREEHVRRLLTHIAGRFPGANIFFDAIPPWMSRRTLRGRKITKLYTVPPMPWGITIAALPSFIRSIPRLVPVSLQTYSEPFPRRMRFYKLLSSIKPVRRRFAASLAHVFVSMEETIDERCFRGHRAGP